MSKQNEILDNLLEYYLSFITEDVLTEERKKRKFWIQKAIKHPGALHKALGVAKGKKIPAKKLVAKPGDSTKMKRMKALAKNLKKISKGKK